MFFFAQIKWCACIAQNNGLLLLLLSCMVNFDLKCSWSHWCWQRITTWLWSEVWSEDDPWSEPLVWSDHENPQRKVGTLTWSNLCWNVCLPCFQEQSECTNSEQGCGMLKQIHVSLREPIVNFSGIFWTGCWYYILNYIIIIKLY